MKRFFGRTLLLFLVSNVFFVIVAQTSYTMPVTLAVTSTGINRFIASQWSTIPHSWSGTYQNGNYSIQLARPAVSLSDNTIKIALNLTIASPLYNKAVTITPTLDLPATNVSASAIIGRYLDLRAKIDAVTELTDVPLKDIIQQVLSPIDWIVYQGQILNTSSGRLLEGADLKWSGLPTLSFSVTTDEVDITITPAIVATAPGFTFYSMNPQDHRNLYRMKVTSNDLFSIETTNADKVYVIGNSQQVNLNISTALPITAVYDAGTQKYTVNILYVCDYNITGAPIVTRLQLKRNSILTLWSVENTLTADYSTCRVSAIRGE